MTGRKADLHVHTTASDGRLTPFQVVEEAARVGLAGLGICDHDTTGGLEEAIEAGRRLGVIIVPGIEINTDFGESELHILGYYFDRKSPALVGHLRELQEARFKRGMQMVDQLRALGCDISFERVKEFAAGGSIGRPHVARALVEAGCAYDMNSAFGKFLIRGAPGYVPRYKITPHDAVRIVREAGGVPGIAHPGNSKHDEVIPDLVKAGLQSLEVWHTDHSKLQEMHYRHLASKYGLIPTGGSDYHGPEMMKRVSVGHVRVDMEIVLRLKKQAEDNRGA